MKFISNVFHCIVYISLFFGSHLAGNTENDLLDDDDFNLVKKDDYIIKGLNWFGFETQYFNLMCTWAHDIEWHIEKIDELGFNYIRLPFSVEFTQKGEWKDMDEFFEKIQYYNIDVALDCHRLHSTHQSAKPYDNYVSFDDFLESWRTILSRYVDVPNLKAVDIFNEYQSDNYVEWNSIARQTLEYLEYHFPGRFKYFVGGTNWGGSLHYVNLEDLFFKNRISYTVHKYWFSDSDPYEDKWDYSFADLDLPVVNIGEWGYKSESLQETSWAEKFVDFLKEKSLTDTFFWTYSFNSIDTGGILLYDCTSVDEDKMALLHKLWTPNR